MPVQWEIIVVRSVVVRVVVVVDDCVNQVCQRFLFGEVCPLNCVALAINVSYFS
jgi:hypothetical protein